MLARVNIEAVLLANQRFLFTGIGIDHAKLCLLVAARAMFIKERLAVRRPPEKSRPALKWDFEGSGFHIGALAGQNVKHHHFAAGQGFARERINVVVSLWPKLVRRHKLQAGEASRISRIDAESYELGRIWRPEHFRALANIFSIQNTFVDQRSQIRKRSRVIPARNAIASQLDNLSSRRFANE